MRLPIRHVQENLIFTTHGTVWAVWRVAATNYSHAPAVVKKRRLKALEGLFKAMTGEPMLLSLCPQIDPTAVVRAMVDDIDLERAPRYESLGHAVLDQLETMELTGRTDWLALPLPPLSQKDAVMSAFRAAKAEVSLQLGLMPAVVTDTEVQRRLEQAQRIQAQWPTGVSMRTATEAEILWIYGHSARRGLAEPFLPDGTETPVRGRGRNVAALGEILVGEGGADFNTRPALPANPFTRRFLQVSSEWGDSYQALLALSEMPEAFALPGAAYLQQLDDLACPVDWTARLVIVPGSKAEPHVRKRARHLKAQAAEYEGDPAGPPAAVARNQADNEEYHERLTANRREVEIRAMVTLAVWGNSPDDAMDRAAALASDFGSTDYTFSRPAGEQASLWQAMLPGCRTPRVMAGYAQILLARDFAMAMPWCGSQLGDERGGLYGLQVASGGARPVLIDPARGPRENASASMAWLGELGAGKSVGMKGAVYNVLARGHQLGRPGSRGRAVIVDRTTDQEWARFAKACPGTTQLIRIDHTAEVSLDPLRLYKENSPQVAARFTESFLTLLLGVRPMDLEGVALSEAVQAVLARPEPSMRALMAELTARGAGDTAAQGLARKLASVARKDLARVVFDETLPVVDTHRADSVVFLVSSLALPKKSELASEHRIQRLEFEKVLGRALMYLIAAVSRETAMRSRDEFAVTVFDECWWLTSSDEGLELLLELLRDGRKRNAAAYVGSHDADDIGPADSEKGAIVRGLIPHRFVFRQTSRPLAARSLEFLGVDSTDTDLLDLVTGDLSPLGLPDDQRRARAGECLYRDLAGRIGLMRVLIPRDRAIERAIHTTPTSQQAAA
ncbi:ATP-binding protein [Streptomyces gardneri]|uniref:ATP/GTP-binding protein n=1 Tax=Streptomyces gardneri TaxID=66892 RepID=A0A4Y3RKB8_9ACTN|nr:ATP-binding protein [Streptomyces gardneri]GEB57388.1 ATP/GTP-binding protein [Streptomyces gardneri]GHH12850.1 ATP/GTP-binding protein [Streptomyces gardneri]